MKDLQMFCFQCEQTAKGQGCTRLGVCGKQPETAALQDLLIFSLKGLSQAAHAGREEGVVDSVENYDIKPISTPEEDLKAILG